MTVVEERTAQGRVWWIVDDQGGTAVPYPFFDETTARKTLERMQARQQTLNL